MPASKTPGGEIAVRVREATLSDIPGIVRVNIVTWRDAYKGLIPDGILDALSREERVKAFCALLSEDGVFSYIAEDASRGVAGFVVAGPARFREFNHEGEVYSLYVEKEFQRRGVGALLLGAALNKFREKNVGSVCLMVLEGSRFRRFYEKNAGEMLCSKSIELQGVPLRVVAYGWELQP